MIQILFLVYMTLTRSMTVPIGNNRVKNTYYFSLLESDLFEGVLNGNLDKWQVWSILMTIHIMRSHSSCQQDPNYNLKTTGIVLGIQVIR